MEDIYPKTQTCIHWRVLLLLSALLLLAYSNTFNASWHLDDFNNITKNSQIHINNLYPDELYNAAFEHTGNTRVFYRPLAYLSFSFNWYFGKTDVTGYHIVNIAIHILTSFILYLAVQALFKTPALIGRYKESGHFIALLSALLWATNPIQTQAVTYIVQRMAIIAALFYVLGIYLYINARISVSWKNRVMLYTGVFLAFLLAIGSKENALMFPGALFLVEIIFFQDLSDRRIRKRSIWLGCSLAAALFILGVLLFMDGGFIARLQHSYENRTFSLLERVLTEPRIVVFYLSQIFYPIADRLSIVHEIEVSTGFFQPWKTLPAILFLLGLAAAGLSQIKRYPLFSFAILFYLLNHVIESSIISLELIFEHRNYLPSLFLFVPVAVGIKWGIDYYYTKEKKAMAVIIAGFVSLLIVALGTGTYVRNMAWANEYSLWNDALKKAPNSSRPYNSLAAGYYSDIKDYDKVFVLCKKAMSLKNDTRKAAEVLALENIANVYAKRDENYTEVVKTYEQVLETAPGRLNSHYHLVLALVHTGKLDKALKKISQLLSYNPRTLKYLNVRALIHLQKNQPEKALLDLKKAMQIVPNDTRANLSLGMAKLMTGKYGSATHYLLRIPENSSHKTIALLLLIENNVRAGNIRNAEKYAKKLVFKVSPEIIKEKLTEANESRLTWPISKELVAPVIANVLRRQSMAIINL